MGTSPPDQETVILEDDVSLLTLPPELAWRPKAACKDQDTNLFFIMDQEELGLDKRDPKKMALLNKERLDGLKRKFCDHCEVVAECGESAIHEGSHVWSLRGGLTPYDREDITPGKILPDGIYQDNQEVQERREYARFLRGERLPEGNDSGRHVRKKLNKQRSETPEDCSWDEHSIPQGRGSNKVPAGRGWALSQDPTGWSVMVLYRSERGVLLTRTILAKHATFDVENTPRVLVFNFSDGVNLPKEKPGFFRDHKAGKGVGADDFFHNPWWKDNVAYF